jgi:hypothetical protein
MATVLDNLYTDNLSAIGRCGASGVTKEVIKAGLRTNPITSPFFPVSYETEQTTKPSNKVALGYEQITRLLSNAGLTQPVLDWAYAQAAFETAGFTHIPAKNDFNLSGITWLNKPYQDATKGRPKPDDKGHYYAKFANFNKWATDFVRILNLGQNKPINATSMPDYVNRLAANGYFDTRKKDAKANYLRGMQFYLSLVPKSKEIRSEIITKSIDDRKSNEGFAGWWNRREWYEKGGLILTTVLLINNITKK